MEVPRKIEPALTEEQWERYLRGDRLDELVERPEHSTETLAVNLPGHPMAALGLYGKQYGFTRQDLSVLDKAKAFAESAHDGLHRKNLDSLRDRLEALLPPEHLEKKTP